MATPFKQKILPASSASFHHFENTTYRELEKINQQLDLLNKRLDNLDKLDGLNEIISRQHTIEEEIKINQQQNRLYAEALSSQYNQAPSPIENRKNIFKYLPEATGQLRFCQKVTTKLMYKLHELLAKNNIEYWFGYGSLLGATLRNGPIPWDDDIDICMHRRSLEKLIKLLHDNPDFQITIVYDYYAMCIQYRFCSRDFNIPSFIDIGVWDYATKFTEEKESQLQLLRLQLMQELEQADLPYWKKQKYIFDPNSGKMRQMFNFGSDKINQKKQADEAAKIKNIFQSYINKATDEKIFCQESEAVSYAYSLDNLLMPGRRMIYDKPMISPTKKVQYDGYDIMCPRQPEKFLDFCYRDWPYIPTDSSILGLAGHFDKNTLNDQKVRQAMQTFIDSA